MPLQVKHLEKILPLLLIAACLIAYHNSFSGPFIFDDVPLISDNGLIRHIRSPLRIFSGSTRPVVDFTLAVNYAVGALDVWGYHAVNVAVHFLAALALYGIVRRSLRSENLKGQWGTEASWIAFGVALIWELHPIQTQGVDYLIQRGESLMGLFYLLTLYCVIRGDSSKRHGWWSAAAIASCALGMGSKAVMVTAPLMVLLYDRIFLAGSFGEAFRRRRGLYAGLAATWAILVLLTARSPNLAEKGAGFGMPGTSSLQYAATQPGVVAHYLRLAVWPKPLTLDYGWPLAKTAGEIIPPLLFIAVLIMLTLWALAYRPALGYLGAWIFVILAPTSSFIPLADPAFEYRMYLPLAAVCVLFVVTVRAWVKNRNIAVIIVLAAAIGLGWGTLKRNMDYRSAVSIWQDVVGKRTENARGYQGAGDALLEEGNLEGALAQCVHALKLNPSFPEAHNSLGMVLAKLERWDEAALHFKAAINLKPYYAEAHSNLGVILIAQGKADEAVLCYSEAMKHNPAYAMAHYNMGIAYAKLGRLEDAMAEYRRALEIRPDFAEVHNNMGNLLFNQTKLDEAKLHYNEAIRAKPDYADAYTNFGNVFFHQGKWSEAQIYYEEALRLDPGLAQAHYNLSLALAKQGKTEEAAKHFAAAQKK